jgi:hypothetical protein
VQENSQGWRAPLVDSQETSKISTAERKEAIPEAQQKPSKNKLASEEIGHTVLNQWSAIEAKRESGGGGMGYIGYSVKEPGPCLSRHVDRRERGRRGSMCMEGKKQT